MYQYLEQYLELTAVPTNSCGVCRFSSAVEQANGVSVAISVSFWAPPSGERMKWVLPPGDHSDRVPEPSRHACWKSSVIAVPLALRFFFIS